MCADFIWNKIGWILFIPLTTKYIKFAIPLQWVERTNGWKIHEQLNLYRFFIFLKNTRYETYVMKIHTVYDTWFDAYHFLIWCNWMRQNRLKSVFMHLSVCDTWAGNRIKDRFISYDFNFLRCWRYRSTFDDRISS